MSDSQADTSAELRERIILLLGNALYSGKSIQQISKITNKELEPFETATDQIMLLIQRQIDDSVRAAVIKELNSLHQYAGNGTRAKTLLASRITELKDQGEGKA